MKPRSSGVSGIVTTVAGSGGGSRLATHAFPTDGRSWHGLDGEARLSPRVEAPGERADALDAAAPQKQRRPGAAGFAGSRAVEDHVTEPVVGGQGAVIEHRRLEEHVV